MLRLLKASHLLSTLNDVTAFVIICCEDELHRNERFAVKKKRRKSAAIPSLNRLVEFLNWDPITDPSIHVREKIDVAWDSKATLVLEEIKADVQNLLKPPPIPSDANARGNTRAEFCLREVIAKIESIVGIPVFEVLPWPKGPLSSRVPLRLGKEKFLVAYTPVPDGMREMTYWALGETLRSGEFSMLRRCSNCSTYFSTTRSNKQTCNRRCSNRHQNSLRSENGVFQEAYVRRKDYGKRAEELFKRAVWGDMQKEDRSKYNKLLRELGRGEDAKGHRKIGKWFIAKSSFKDLDEGTQNLFVAFVKSELSTRK